MPQPNTGMAVNQPVSQGRKRRLGYFRRLSLIGLIFILPALLHQIFFSIYPILRTMGLSFTSYDFSSAPAFNGLANYIRLFRDTHFINSVKVTVFYSTGVSLFLTVVSLAVAMLFDRKFPLRDFFRVIYFVPVVIPWVVTALVWNLIYNPTYGLYHIISDPLGYTKILWIHDTDLVLYALIIIGVWKGFGYYMLIYLAGLQGIPGVYYEAAQIDGANRRKVFRYITLPLLRPSILLVLVTTLIDSFQVFTPVWLMTGGGPAEASRMLTVYTYENAFVFLKMGYATAIATVMLIVLVAITGAQRYFFKPLT